MKDCCRTLKYLGESPIEGYHMGQCVTCGSIRHGAKSNWRLKSSNVRTVMVAVKEKRTAPKNRATRPSFVGAPTITVRPGMTVEDIILALKRQDVRVL